MSCPESDSALDWPVLGEDTECPFDSLKGEQTMAEQKGASQETESVFCDQLSRMPRKANRPAPAFERRGRAGNAILQSVVAGVVLIVVLAAGVYVFNSIMNKKKEQKFYRQTMGAYHGTINPAEKMRHLNTYLERYPRGVHAPEVAALVEEADEKKGLDLVLDVVAVFHDRKTAPLTGRLQLLKSKQSYAELVAAMDKGQKIGKLKQRAESDEAARLELFDAIGTHLQKLKVTVVAEAEADKGKVRFTHLEPGEYLLYGVDVSGTNIIGLFGSLNVREGEDGDISIESYSAYARDAERRAERWKI